MVAFGKNNIFALSIFLLFVFFTSLSLRAFEFVAISDLHLGRDNSYLNARKLEVKRLLLNYLDKNRNRIDFVLMVGDLTDHGSIKKNCVLQDELGIFFKEWFLPISKKVEGGYSRLLLCPGNHDTGYSNGRKLFNGATFFDILKYSGFDNYLFEANDVIFISCGIYPDLNTRQWLKKNLSKISKKTPVVFLFHYTISRPCHGFEDEEKEEFYSCIKEHNVIGIINGHKHRSFIDRWHDIPVVGVGGYGYTVCSIDKDDKLSAKTFFADRKRFFTCLTI